MIKWQLVSTFLDYERVRVLAALLRLDPKHTRELILFHILDRKDLTNEEREVVAIGDYTHHRVLEMRLFKRRELKLRIQHHPLIDVTLRAKILNDERNNVRAYFNVIMSPVKCIYVDIERIRHSIPCTVGKYRLSFHNRRLQIIDTETTHLVGKQQDYDSIHVLASCDIADLMTNSFFFNSYCSQAIKKQRCSYL